MINARAFGIAVVLASTAVLSGCGDNGGGSVRGGGSQLAMHGFGTGYYNPDCYRTGFLVDYCTSNFPRNDAPR